MTEIRWKNGGPLFLQPSPGSPEGLFATEQNCCCPPPPPPRCWNCPSLCSYGFELTAQDGLQVASWLEVCGSGGPAFADSEAEYSFKHLFPPGTVFSSASRSTSFIGPAYGARAIARVSHSARGTILVDSPPAYCTRNFFPTPSSIQVPFSSFAEILFELMCSEGRLPTPYTLRVSVQASVLIAQNLDFIDCGPFCEGKWIWNSAGTFDLNATCSSSPQKHCNVGYTEEFRFLDAPVEVIADKDTTTLGNYTSTFTNTCAGGDLSALALSIGESIRDELTATLNITSRPSCEPCETCADCEFPTTPQFQQGGSIECFGVGTQNSTVGQDVYIGLPPGGLPNGVSWKSGYPAALNNCEWAFVVDSLTIDCCYEDCIINGVPQNSFGGKTRNRYRILLMTCPDGPESVQVTDITDLAVQGDLEFENDNKPAGCPGPPIACTEWFGYFPAPQPVCNEFP